MHVAARGGSVEVVKALIEQGADNHSTGNVSWYPTVMFLNRYNQAYKPCTA